MKKRLFALLLAGLLAVSAAGCADKPDFELSGPQTVGAYTFYQVGDESAEENPLLKTNLYYIYGKCQKIITEDTAGGKMTAVYLQIKHAGKTKYIALAGASADVSALDKDKIVGKTVVAYGTLMDNVPANSKAYNGDTPMLSALYFEVDGEIILVSDFLNFLQAEK